MTKFLIVGRLNEESGVMTACKATKIAREAGLKFNLAIYGRGESSYMAKLRSFVVANQLPVEFPTVSNQSSDLPSVYRRHDVCCTPRSGPNLFPSRPWKPWAAACRSSPQPPAGPESFCATAKTPSPILPARPTTGRAHPGTAHLSRPPPANGRNGPIRGPGQFQRYHRHRPGRKLPHRLPNPRRLAPDARPFPCGQFAALLSGNRRGRPLNESRKVRADPVRNAKHQFHCRIPKSPLHQAEHGLGNTRILGHGIVREFVALPFLAQKPDNLPADGLIMSDCGHGKALQKRARDMYFAMVNYPPVKKFPFFVLRA